MSYKTSWSVSGTKLDSSATALTKAVNSVVNGKNLKKYEQTYIKFKIWLIENKKKARNGKIETIKIRNIKQKLQAKIYNKIKTLK